MNTKIILGFIFVVAAIGLATTISANAAASNTTGSVAKVQAGGGDTSAPLTTFSPQQVQIRVGDRVSWYNPSIVGEPHTVSFVFDNKSMAQFVGPFGVSSSTQFMPLPPGSNNQPLVLPGKNGMNTLISLNARAYNPVAIDSSGNVKTLNPNANYTLSGTEKYVNSGFILPKGHDQNFPGSSNTFTVTFRKAGTFNYLCIVHPWMIGKVMVK
jgi:plastocyanin